MVAARHAKCLAMAPSGGAAQPSNAATARHETFAKEHEEVRARLVAPDFKTKGDDRGDLFAAMPPLEAKKLLSRMAAKDRPS